MQYFVHNVFFERELLLETEDLTYDEDYEENDDEEQAKIKVYDPLTDKQLEQALEHYRSTKS